MFLYLLEEKDVALIEPLDMAELTISSEVSVELGAPPTQTYSIDGVDGVSVRVEVARGSKCQRCWQYSIDVGASTIYPDLCGRCCSVVEQQIESPS